MKVICPVCESENIKDISTYENNGLLGPGAAAWKTFDVRRCNECGVLFQPIESNQEESK